MREGFLSDDMVVAGSPSTSPPKKNIRKKPELRFPLFLGWKKYHLLISLIEPAFISIALPPSPPLLMCAFSDANCPYFPSKKRNKTKYISPPFHLIKNTWMCVLCKGTKEIFGWISVLWQGNNIPKDNFACLILPLYIHSQITMKKGAR